MNGFTKLTPTERAELQRDQIIREVAQLRSEMAEMRGLFNDFAHAYMNAKFPYGRATDRWGRRGAA